MLTYAHELDMYDSTYAFIAVDFVIEESWLLEDWFHSKEIYSGLLSIDVKEIEESKLKKFKEDLRDKFIDYGYDITRVNATVSFLLALFTWLSSALIVPIDLNTCNL